MTHRRRYRGTDGRPNRARAGRSVAPRPDAPVELVGRTDHCDDPMTEAEALRILESSCRQKRQIAWWREADAVARGHTETEGVQVVAYACPFSSITGGGRHHHVGHPPTHEQVERIALAMRWLNEHPEALVTPGDDGAV